LFYGVGKYKVGWSLATADEVAQRSLLSYGVPQPFQHNKDSNVFECSKFYSVKVLLKFKMLTIVCCEGGMIVLSLYGILKLILWII
jgi:hypothetical protein